MSWIEMIQYDLIYGLFLTSLQLKLFRIIRIIWPCIFYGIRKPFLCQKYWPLDHKQRSRLSGSPLMVGHQGTLVGTDQNHRLRVLHHWKGMYCKPFHDLALKMMFTNSKLLLSNIDKKNLTSRIAKRTIIKNSTTLWFWWNPIIVIIDPWHCRLSDCPILGNGWW